MNFAIWIVTSVPFINDHFVRTPSAYLHILSALNKAEIRWRVIIIPFDKGATEHTSCSKMTKNNMIP